MRMEEWTPEIMAFARDAAEFTGYYERLARGVRGHLGTDAARVCDAGCGMGYLGAALAREVPRVVAVDRAPQVVAYATRLGEVRGLGGFRAALADLGSPETLVGSHGVSPRPFDAMVFCTSCRFGTAVLASLACCTGRFVVVSRLVDDDAPDCGRGGRLGYRGFVGIHEALGRLDVPYEGERVEIEYGQPFVSLKDACRFFSLYRTRDFPQGATAAQVRARLADGWGPWRYYLPKRRRLLIVSASVADVRRGCAAHPDAARALLGVRPSARGSGRCHMWRRP